MNKVVKFDNDEELTNKDLADEQSADKQSASMEATAKESAAEELAADEEQPDNTNKWDKMVFLQHGLLLVVLEKFPLFLGCKFTDSK